MDKRKLIKDENPFYKSDGSWTDDDDLYCVDEYVDFVSNGITDNEKVEAQEYYDDYLSEIPEDNL